MSLTKPEHVGVWFGQGQPAEINLRPGGTMVLDHGVHGVFPTRIVTVDEPHRFSYRWASGYPGSSRPPRTTRHWSSSRWRQTATRLGWSSLETGFAALEIPVERQATAGYESHAAGWREVTGNLAKYAEHVMVSALILAPFGVTGARSGQSR